MIAGSFGAFIAWQKLAGRNQQVPFRVIFEGSASGLRKGGSVNFAGIRVGQVVSLKLDNPRRVVALAMIDGNTPVRRDTQVGLEFQGLTGIAAISFTGGTVDAPPVPLGADGIPELTADPEGLLDVQEKIRVALRNVDKVIADNEVAVKDTLRNFETFTASLSGNGERITSIISAAESGVTLGRRRPGQDPEIPRQSRQRQIWRRPAADRDFAARADREFRQEVRPADRRDPENARRAQPVRQQGRPKFEAPRAIACRPDQ